MTLDFEYTPAELLEADRWRPGMGPIWRSVFIVTYLLIAAATLACGFCEARTDVHKTVGRHSPADTVRHLKNLGLLLLPLLPWVAVFFAAIVTSLMSRFSGRTKYIDDSARLPKASITKTLLWASFIAMAAAHELFVTFSSRRLYGATLADQMRDRLPMVSLGVIACAVIAPLRVWYSLPKSRGIRHGLGRRKHVEIDPKGITISDAGSFYHYPWFKIRAIVETLHAYLIFDKPTATNYRLIPKRAFNTPADELEFRQTVIDWGIGRTGGFQVIAIPPPMLEFEIDS